MNGTNILLDTNIVLYLLNGEETLNFESETISAILPKGKYDHIF